MATESITIFGDPRKVCTAVLGRIDEWEARYQRLQERQAELEKLPMLEASLYWHMDAYLYLIGPTKGGYRTRKYIGNQPEKVKDATEAVTRFRSHRTISKELQHIENRIMETQFSLQQCLSMLEDWGHKL